MREEEIPADYLDMVAEKRDELISALAEVNEEFEEKYLMEEEFTVQEIKDAIRKHTLANEFSPVFMGSAYKNKGIQAVLNGVVDYLPNPTERNNTAFDLSKEEEEVALEINEKKPFVGLAFKLEETQFGQVTYIRVYQGKIKKGAMITNTATKKKVKVSRMVRMHSDDMEEVSEVGPGDIFAIFGVDCASGETFCDGANYSMRTMHVPDPVLSLTIKPKQRDNLNKFLLAL